MIRKIESYNLNVLGNHLADELMNEVSDDPFRASQIIVPNRDTLRWLQLLISEKAGIAANIEFLLPAEWEYRMIRKIYPDLPRTLPSDVGSMKWSIFELLSDEETCSGFQRLHRYIFGRENRESRRAAMELSGQIASVFDQYLMYRPGMLLKWQKGEHGMGDEAWQAELWNRLNKDWKANLPKELQKNKAELHNDALNALTNGTLKKKEPLYLFNPGLIPAPINDLLRTFEGDGNLSVFRIKPAEKMAGSLNENSNELLTSFGDEASRINGLFDHLKGDLKNDFPFEEKPDRKLSHIQSSIIQNSPLPSLKGESLNDIEIEIRSCHSPLREVETLHQFLLQKFEEDPELNPDDVLVSMPNLQRYMPYIHAVFGASEEGLPSIPYSVSSGRGKESEGVEMAFMRILKLVNSRFTASDVMDLFAMKPIYEGLGLSESQTTRVRTWIDDNTVLWGWDSSHRTEFGQPGADLQTWNSAIRRIWLGQLLGAQGDKEFEQELLYDGVRTGDDFSIWASFSKYLNRLNDIREDLKRDRSCAEWCRTIRGWTESFFSAKTLEGDAVLSILSKIENLENSAVTVKSELPISYGIFRSELNGLMDSFSAGTAHFTRGVIFSSMVPVRSIPRKIVALIGLSESEYPRKPSTPDFDLMAQNPDPFDRDRKAEDRNLFLESILSAEETHYVSFIGKSEKDNETIPPSPIVGEWLTALSNCFGVAVENLIRQEPLNGFSNDYFMRGESYSPVSFSTAKNISRADSHGSGLMLKKPLEIRDEKPAILVDELIRCFNNPTRYFLKDRLGAAVYGPDEEKDEFEFNHLEKHLLFERVFGWKLKEISPDAMQKILIQSGMLPAGWPGRKILQEYIMLVERAFEELKSIDTEPIINLDKIDITINNSPVNGIIKNYSNTKFLELNPSGFSGKVALQAWIKHLLICSSGLYESEESLLLCELKKDPVKWFRFKPVENSDELLSELISLYRQARTKPLYFFPKTLSDFEQESREKNDENRGVKKAKDTFEGGYFSGEREELSISLLMGEDALFNLENVDENSRNIFRQMWDHMEEIK